MDAYSKRRTVGSSRNKHQIYGHCRRSAYRPWVLRSRAARPSAGSSPSFCSPGHQDIAGLCACVGRLVQARANPEFRSGWRWGIIWSNPASKPSPSINARCGLTLPSSGRPPAWPASLLWSMFRCAGQAGGRLSCQTLGITTQTNAAQPNLVPRSPPKEGAQGFARVSGRVCRLLRSHRQDCKQGRRWCNRIPRSRS
jgi:hypothetical protein